MAFLITEDKISNGEAVGTEGPFGITEEVKARLQAGEGLRFKMYDDDGELYYHGLYIEEDDSDEFEPLDCFGLPNAGCTRIDMFNPKKGKMETV